ncbi:tyrosine-type recombinase/integrase [Alcaligenes phenolicus]
MSRICLATDARWDEAEQLQAQQVRQRLIQFVRIKNGKARAISISQEIQDEIAPHHAEYRNMGTIFTGCTGTLKEAIKRASTQLPMGQLTHVLLHTFASHFMINGGNILILQRILGHQDLKTTMRYAHLAPDHLNSARILNPLVS